MTSLSRFYRTGNSTPTVYESMPTDAVYVQFRPSVWLNDTSGFTGSNVTVVVSMNNSMGISAEVLSMTFAYDADVLEPVRIRTTGLTDELEGVAASVASAGTWRFAAQGGAVATGAGQLLLLDFKIKDVHDVTETTVSLVAATLKALDGRVVALDLPKSATVEISDSNPIVPAIVAVSVADAAVDSETEFALPVTVTATETLTNFTATLTWDEKLLELRGIQTGLTGLSRLTNNLVNLVNPVKNSYALQASGGDFTLTFYAKAPESAATNFAARVSLSDIAAVDCHGFAVLADDAAGTVLIRNAKPPVAPTFALSVLDVRAESGQPFVVNVGTESVGDLAETTFTVERDDAKMSFAGTREAATVETLSANSRRLMFASSGTDNRYHLNFAAAKIAGLRESAQVRVTAVSATGANGLAGVLQTPLPVGAPLGGWQTGTYALLSTTTTGLKFTLADAADATIRDVTADGLTTYYADVTVEGSVEVVSESGTLPAATRAQAKSLIANELAEHTEVASVTVKGDAALVAAAADLGIAPQLDVLGTEATATYRAPTLQIVAFEPETGRVRIKVTPGEGNAIRAPLATGCVHIYGTSDLSQKMRYISGAAT